jgi:hypothetical protein
MPKGPTRILSAAEAEEMLAAPCLMILLGLAQPVFPNWHRGSPSVSVLVQQVRSASVGLYGVTPVGVLPCWVDWRQWQQGVVPVLKDERWRVGTPLANALLRTEGPQGLLGLIGQSLRQSFEQSGW